MKTAGDYIILIIIGLFISLMVTTCVQSKRVSKALEELNEQEIQCEAEKEDIMQVCRLQVEAERIIYRVDGCYDAIELICGEKAKNIQECQEILGEYCRRIGE